MEEFPFWSVASDEIYKNLNTSQEGLSQEEVVNRLNEYAGSVITRRKRSSFSLFLSQFKSPIILLLIFAAILSIILSDSVDATIILIIVVLSGFLGFIQERGAVNAVDNLLKVVQIKVNVIRNGKEVEAPFNEIVPGDVVIFNAGDVIPGDCLLLETKDFFVDEAAMTGEAFPVEKKEGTVPENTPLNKRTNSVFMGSHVVTGTAKAIVVFIGKDTVFGKLSEKLKKLPPENSFEQGVKRFGYFLMKVTLFLVLAIFAINIMLHRPFLESFLFALALAVGLTPQLLPAIITVNLSHGAKKMAQKQVIVKKLVSIENFGSMDTLCTDKTGTLTVGEVRFETALDYKREGNDKTALFAFLNASMQSGYTNPIDKAILQKPHPEASNYQKIDEWPFDFMRKRISIFVKKDDDHILITKGAFPHILHICTKAENKSGDIVPLNTVQSEIEKSFEYYTEEGFRVIGVTYRDFGAKASVDKQDEVDMIFLGFLLFFDPPKEGVAESVKSLKRQGVSLKIITGDHHLTAKHIANQIGFLDVGLITGEELKNLDEMTFQKKVQENGIFAEIEPAIKEHIIIALKQAGHTVGYMGDGINDVTALHAADVSISVDSAADVAKEVADIVLLKKDLSVLSNGVQEGRRTFANTLKYIFMATSANFGNMFSMAGASLFLSFLPLLPKQILLINLLTDFPEMTIATDNVDREFLAKPVKWDLSFIRKFMLVFGLISSIFDYMTFGVLIWILRANVDQFRTGWFIESVLSASLIVLVVRTRKLCFKSAPSKYLAGCVLATCAITLILPYSPLAFLFNFIPVPTYVLFAIGGIVALYVITVEIGKRFFYRNI